MTLSGTEVFVLYILFYPLAYKYFSIRWRYFILKVSMVLYLIPFAWFKFIVLDKIFKLFPTLKSYLVDKKTDIDITEYIIFKDGFKTVSWKIKTIWLLMFFVGFISIILIYMQLKGYIKLKRSFFRQDVSNSYKEVDIFQKEKKALRVKNKVGLLYSGACDTPFTIGVLRPTIVMPLTYKTIKATDSRYIIVHELNHINNHDIFFKFCALLAVAINWYNPICHFMYCELCNVSELYCDFCTTKEMDLEERKKYCNLIVDIATEDKKNVAKQYIAPLVNSDTKIIERRILELKKFREPKKLILSWCLGGAICVIGSITSFAYNPPATYSTKDVSDVNTEIVFQQVIALPFDYFWTDCDGNISEINENNSEKAYCPHSYEPGTITKHTKYSDRSCKMVYLDGKKCSLCGNILEGSVIKTVHYDVCPH